MEDIIEHVANPPEKKRKNRFGLAHQIVAGLVIGVVTGLFLHAFPQWQGSIVSSFLQPAGDIFIRLIKMVVVPIVFTSMVTGIAGVGDSKALGRVGAKTIVYFEIITTIAIVIGLVFANLLQPGVGTDLSKLGHADMSRYQQIAEQGHGQHGLMNLVLSIIPENIVASMAKGDLLPLIFFSLVFGIALQKAPEEARKPVLALLKGVADTMFRVTGMIMRYAPFGVFAMITITVLTFGADSLLPLIKLVAVTYFAIFTFVIVVLGFTARLFGFRLLQIIRVIKDELIIAFSTCSSASVLPQLMQKIENFGVPKSITTFVIPTGYTFNLDGAAIYLGIGALFIAQIYGIHLGWEQQLVLTLTMVVTSKGVAAVPGFMFVTLLTTLASAGLPLEGLALVAGIDRILDMGRTSLNVVGNALAPLVIAKWEGTYDAEKGQAYLASLESE